MRSFQREKAGETRWLCNALDELRVAERLAGHTFGQSGGFYEGQDGMGDQTKVFI